MSPTTKYGLASWDTDRRQCLFPAHTPMNPKGVWVNCCIFPRRDDTWKVNSRSLGQHRVGHSFGEVNNDCQPCHACMLACVHACVRAWLRNCYMCYTCKCKTLNIPVISLQCLFKRYTIQTHGDNYSIS